MFKNLIIYRIAATWVADFAALEAALAKSPFAECGPTQERSAGWVPPRQEEHGALAENIGGQWICRFMTESKLLPASVLARKVQEKAEAIEQAAARLAAGSLVGMPTPNKVSISFNAWADDSSPS